RTDQWRRLTGAFRLTFRYPLISTVTVRLISPFIDRILASGSSSTARTDLSTLSTGGSRPISPHRATMTVTDRMTSLSGGPRMASGTSSAAPPASRPPPGAPTATSLFHPGLLHSLFLRKGNLWDHGKSLGKSLGQARYIDDSSFAPKRF